MPHGNGEKVAVGGSNDPKLLFSPSYSLEAHLKGTNHHYLQLPTQSPSLSAPQRADHGSMPQGLEAERINSAGLATQNGKEDTYQG